MTKTPIPGIPSADKLYDHLMAKIEPELTGAKIQGLKEKYAGESEEERSARTERYRKAFANYDQSFQKYLDDLDEKIRIYRKEIIVSAETEAQEKEDQVLADLERQFSAE